MDKVYIIDGKRVLVEGPVENWSDGQPFLYIVKDMNNTAVKLVDANFLDTEATEVNLNEYTEGALYTNGKDLALITKVTDNTVTVEFRPILNSPYDTQGAHGTWTIPKDAFALGHTPLEIQLGDVWVDLHKQLHRVALLNEHNVVLGFPYGIQVSKVGLFSNYFLVRDGGANAVQE